MTKEWRKRAPFATVSDAKTKKGAPESALSLNQSCGPDYILSVTTVVVAPSGSLVMTGSEPPDSRDFTVRS